MQIYPYNSFYKNQSNYNLQKSVYFKGLSSPSQYQTTFEYLASQVLANSKTFAQVSEDMCSSKRIKKTIEAVLSEIDIFRIFPKAYQSKIKWAAHLPEHIRQFAVERANLVRETRLSQWGNVLNNPEESPELVGHTTLIQKIKKLKGSLKIVTWDAITSELSEYNKHTPVPFDAKAFEEAIDDYERLSSKSRKVRCKKFPFIKMYTHRLRDNVLETMGLSENQSVWVKIPSLKNDPANASKNIEITEILSHTNWCTRSSQYKAKDVLERGNFYINLVRDQNELWEPRICVVTNKRGKVDEIQTGANNDFIPTDQVENIKNFLREHQLKLDSGIDESGPKAYEQLAIATKLGEVRPEINIPFGTCIKNKDYLNIFKYLDYKVCEQFEEREFAEMETLWKDLLLKAETRNKETIQELFESFCKLLKAIKKTENAVINLENPTEIKFIDATKQYIISTYKPFHFDKNSKQVLPYNLMNINEDILLSNVSKIDGDFVLFDPKHRLFTSRITHFPQKLKEVTGKIYCNQEQYEKFGEQMKLVVKDPKQIVIRS